jgi:hypothetical protein
MKIGHIFVMFVIELENAFGFGSLGVERNLVMGRKDSEIDSVAIFTHI